MPDINNITTMPTIAETAVKSVVSTPIPQATPTSNDSATWAVPKQPAKPDLKEAWTDIDKDKDTDALKNAITGGISKQGNVDIYAMPKEFQKHNAVAGSNFSLGTFVMLAGLLLFFVAGSLAVVYFLKPELLTKITGLSFKDTSDQPSNQVVTDKDILALVTPPATTTPDIATTTATSTIATSTPPKETYLAYNIELSKINTFSDYYLLVNKYGSASQVEQIEAEKLIADSSADHGVSKILAVRRSIPILDTLAQVVDNTSDQVAQLNITLTDNISRGVVDMILENGQWKLNGEVWTLPEQNEQLAYIQGEDRDADGLTDAEEDIFGANKESIDTDGDGYTDAVEVSGLYDPNKKAGKLVDSGKFATYLAEEGDYSIIRPSQWSQSKDNTDNSINFRGLDDHYIKVITTENFNNQDLESLYINKWQVGQIDPLLRVTSDTWNGIMSPDGMSLYAVSKTSQSKYYVIEYHLPDKTQILQYKELFLAMIKSFVIKK